jgi:hypothetical protein
MGGTVVSTDDGQWSSAEVVRAVRGLTESLDRFENETRKSIRQMERDFAEHYVSKELLGVMLAPYTEHKDATTRWAHELLGPLITGVIVAAVMYLIQHH